MDNRFLSLKLNLKICQDKADKYIKNAAQKTVHSYEALQISETAMVPRVRVFGIFLAGIT